MNFKYTDHYLMKQNRLLKIGQQGGRCEYCGNPARYIHHKDKKTVNHDLNNLVLVCWHCHKILHYNNHKKTGGFEKTCSYCNIRPRMKVTCGDKFCQLKHHKMLAATNWKKRGKIYNGRRIKTIYKI
jgi:hypothetical protein